MTRKFANPSTGIGQHNFDRIEAMFARDRAKKSEEQESSPLTKAREHLDKEVQRGKHSPKVAGHSTSQHGGRVKADFKAADKDQSDPEAGWHNYTRNLNKKD